MALREIGSAFVRLFIKKDELSAGLKQAETEVKQATGNMQAEVGTETSGGGLFGAIKGLNKAFTATVGTVLKLVGHVGVIIGLIVSAAEAARRLYEWMHKTELAAKELRQETAELANEAYDFDERSTKFDRLRNETLEKLEKAKKNVSGGRADPAIVKEIENLEKILTYLEQRRDAAIAAQEAGERASARSRADEEELARLKKRNDEITPADIAESEYRAAEAKRATDEEAHKRRLEMIQKEADARVEAERRAIQQIESFRSQFRGQSSGGDIRQIVGMLKTLIDSQR